MTNEIINSEMLNEEQLNAVVGGTRGELSCDTKFLHALGLMDHYYEPYYVGQHWREVTAEVSAAVKKTGSLGVGITYYSKRDNKYLLALVDLGVAWHKTRAEMYHAICRAVGKPRFDYKPYL